MQVPDESKLVSYKYGDQHFPHQVWSMGIGVGQELALSAAERI